MNQSKISRSKINDHMPLPLLLRMGKKNNSSLPCCLWYLVDANRVCNQWIFYRDMRMKKKLRLNNATDYNTMSSSIKYCSKARKNSSLIKPMDRYKNKKNIRIKVMRHRIGARCCPLPFDFNANISIFLINTVKSTHGEGTPSPIIEFRTVSMSNESAHLVIGTRGSDLALWQTNFVRERLLSLSPGLDVRIRIIKTTGDRVQDKPLPQIGEKGLFTKELNNAILDGEIDCAVHSFKDLPTELPEGMELSAVLGRQWRNDVLISPIGKKLEELPRGAKVATSSLRRKAMLLYFRPDFRFVDIRGNVDTRLRKVKELGYDALIMAEPGIRRLKLEDAITQVIPFSILLPAPAQGALAITMLAENSKAPGYVRELNENTVLLETTAERSFLEQCEGGCFVPIGASAVLSDGLLRLEGAIASEDGKTLIRNHIEGNPESSAELGIALAEKILDGGGREILEKIRGKS